MNVHGEVSFEKYHGTGNDFIVVDADEYGGAPLLGLQEGCIIAHGSSSPKAIKNALGQARLLIENDCNKVIGKRIETLQFPES